ncbi:MAG: biotin--[acetyl-CoA-carboxylase] ligase [Gammaproteobacteria bacterium]|nr:biotin--[acetyl-CoA-carboxylase] ligase [Gammaproteobacteria bacterium]OUV68552.1 MAG: biotin--[acetyl-CoA-carboxylase] ligase [Gammaproteobacteria bacterium TMED133]
MQGIFLMVDQAERQVIKTLISNGSVEYSAKIEDEASMLGLNTVKDGSLLVLQSPIELLDSDKIKTQLTHSALDLEILWTVDSTNSYLMRSSAKPFKGYRVCLAEYQERGRGRRGRRWISSFGRNLCISIARKYPQTNMGLGGLSLAVGIQLAKTLKQKGVANLGLKWPNDVLLDYTKLAGILVEIGPALGAGLYVVVGIGVNLDLTSKDSLQIEQPHNDLHDVLDFSRNILAGEIIHNVISGLDIFSQVGFTAFAKEWQEHNLFRDRVISVHIADSVVTGTDAGVDGAGNLLLLTDEGLKSFNAGEVSLRGSR